METRTGGRWTRRLDRFGPGHGLAAVFVVTILVPGVLVVAFAVRALFQDMQLARVRIAQDVEQRADLALAAVQSEMEAWREAVRLVDDPRPEQLGAWPERVQRVVGVAGGAIMLGFGERVEPVPQRQLLYRLAGQLESAATPPRSILLDEAEAAELVAGDYPLALRLYERLLSGADPRRTAIVTHRLARTSRKAGLLVQARRWYARLAGLEGGQIGGLPADFVGGLEMCALSVELGDIDDLATAAGGIYRGLVEGRWRLEKSRYLYYSGLVKEWLDISEGHLDQITPLRAIEHRKLGLSLAAETFVKAPTDLLTTDAGTVMALWTRGQTAALLISEPLLQAEIGRVLNAIPETSGLEMMLLDRDGAVVVGDAPGADATPLVTRSLAEVGLPWRLQVWPADLSLSADLAQRRNLYFALLGFVVVLIASGSFLTFRSIRREFEVSRLKSDFVSTVSHEFRSPLTGIRQLGEMLAEGRISTEEKREEYYQLIVRESSRLTRLVENILDFSTMEEGRKQYDFAAIDTVSWLSGLVSDFAMEAAQKGIQVESDVPERLPEMYGDKEALSSAVLNLLDNAVKYSAASETVWLKAADTVEGLEISVRDRGLGISAEDRRHLFEKFFRGSAARIAQAKGAGVGLSLVKHVIEAHYGAIRVDGQPDEGTTFVIQLPRVPNRSNA